MGNAPERCIAHGPMRGWRVRLGAGTAPAVAAILAGGAACAQMAVATNFSGSVAGVSVSWDYGTISYGSAPPLPVGVWDDQYQNFFNGVPTPPGPNWNTWSSLSKPTTLAGWTGVYYSNPFLRSDTLAGSVDRNGTRLRLTTGLFNGNALYASKLVIATASAAKPAQSPAIAHTRITDPSTFTDPTPGDDWSVETSFAELGSLVSADPSSTLSDQVSITVDPTSGSPVTYNLFSFDVTAGGAGDVTSDLNNNDASVSDTLYSGQLNGILLMNGVQVTAAQATADLLKMYSASSGWNLNPDGYDYDTFDPSNPSEVANVFNLTAVVFFDSSTASASVNTIDEADAVSVAAGPIPEPSAWAMLVLGAGAAGAAMRRARRRAATAAA